MTGSQICDSRNFLGRSQPETQENMAYLVPQSFANLCGVGRCYRKSGQEAGTEGQLESDSGACR